MAPTPLKSSQSQETTPRRSRRIATEEDAEDTIVVDTTTQSSRTTNAPLDTSPNTPNTPTTRKRKVDYANLHNFRFQGRPPPSPKPGPLAKRARVSNAAKSQEASQATIIPEESQEEDDDEDILEKKKKQPNASGKRAWWWKYYTIKTLTTTYDKGKGKIKERAFDEKYTCNICKNFDRLALRLKGSTTALVNHIQADHRRSDDSSGSTEKVQSGLDKFVKSKEDIPDFEDAMVDWIVDTCQPFTTSEKTKFRVMIRSAGYTGKIVGGDTVAKRVLGRVEVSENDLIALLDRTCVTIAISFDGWTSTNKLSMFAMNGKWAGPDMKIYQACLDFIEIKGAHSGRNLAQIVYKRGKKLGILHKIISLTGDNAKNNDTCARYLHKMMGYIYDEHLDPMPVHDKSMRFKGEASKIDCLAHVDNLVVKAILKSLGSSTHKDAVAFLDRVSDNGWNKVTLPMASGDIAVLRIVVLWMNRSPQRIQEWLAQEGVTSMIPYDVDTRWNYTLVMLEAAILNRAALKAFIKNHPEIAHLSFDNERWKRLKQIRDLLKPFEEHTLFVSREEPTLHRLPNLYHQLEKLLLSIVKKEGVYAMYDSSLLEATQKGLDKFNGYYTEMKKNDMYWIACCLDPRIKAKWLIKNHPDHEAILNRVKSFLKEAYLSEEELPVRPRDQAQKMKMSLELEYLQEYGSAVTVDDDIERYFNTPSVNFVLNEKENQTEWILNWWKVHKQEYPLMFQVARDYLPIPGAEVDVERLFNIAREMLGLRRASMAAETLRALILLKDYIRREAAGQV